MYVYKTIGIESKYLAGGEFLYSFAACADFLLQWTPIAYRELQPMAAHTQTFACLYTHTERERVATVMRGHTEPPTWARSRRSNRVILFVSYIMRLSPAVCWVIEKKRCSYLVITTDSLCIYNSVTKGEKKTWSSLYIDLLFLCIPQKAELSAPCTANTLKAITLDWSQWVG